MTDAELIRCARGESRTDPDSEARSSAAWNTLSQRYLPVVWRYAYALLQDSHAAEDVVSEVMLALLKSIHQIDDQSPKISAWLRSVVRHKVADHHRRAYRAKDHLPRVAHEQQRKNGAQQIGGAADPLASDPSAPLLVAERKKQVARILEGLPERQRLALEWKYVEGLRVKEIAKRLGETEKAVEATLYRARREFRRLYELSETNIVGIPGGSVSNSAPDNSALGFPW